MGEDGQDGYEVSTTYEKLVADYLRITVPEVQGLDYIYYLRIRRDAFIRQMRATEEGRDYLANAWRLSRTEPDREGSRRAFGGRSVHGND